MEEQYIMQLFRGICEAIKVMHTSHDPIAHRDITVRSHDPQMSQLDIANCTANKSVAKQRQAKLNSY